MTGGAGPASAVLPRPGFWPLGLARTRQGGIHSGTEDWNAYRRYLACVKVIGALMLAATLFLVAVACLVPTHVSIFGQSLSCGIPAKTAFESAGDDYGCQRASLIRLGEVVAFFVVFFTASMLLLILGPSEGDKERARFEEWQRYQHWQDQQRRP